MTDKDHPERLRLKDQALMFDPDAFTAMPRSFAEKDNVRRIDFRQWLTGLEGRKRDPSED